MSSFCQRRKFNGRTSALRASPDVKGSVKISSELLTIRRHGALLRSHSQPGIRTPPSKRSSNRTSCPDAVGTQTDKDGINAERTRHIRKRERDSITNPPKRGDVNTGVDRTPVNLRKEPLSYLTSTSAQTEFAQADEALTNSLNVILIVFCFLSALSDAKWAIYTINFCLETGP